jgi:hypothetical protein
VPEARPPTDCEGNVAAFRVLKLMLGHYRRCGGCRAEAGTGQNRTVYGNTDE